MTSNKSHKQRGALKRSLAQPLDLLGSKVLKKIILILAMALASAHASCEEEITREAYFEIMAPFVEEAICGEAMRSASGMTKSKCEKEKKNIKNYCREKLSEVIPPKFEAIRDNTSKYWSFHSKCLKQQVLKGS